MGTKRSKRAARQFRQQQNAKLLQAWERQLDDDDEDEFDSLYEQDDHEDEIRFR